MKCETVRELLGNYIDEELIFEMRRRVDSHLAACKTCSIDLQTLQAAVSALDAAKPLETPSPWFADRLLHRLAQATDTPLPCDRRPAPDLQLDLW